MVSEADYLVAQGGNNVSMEELVEDLVGGGVLEANNSGKVFSIDIRKIWGYTNFFKTGDKINAIVDYCFFDFG